MDNMIGLRIRQRRKEMNITQTQIQQSTSISSGNLSCIENGKYLPSAIALLELSQILDCSVDWILTGKSSKSNSFFISDIEDNSDIRLLIEYYCALSKDEQDELMILAKMKYNKAQKANNSSGKSSHSESDNITSGIA